MSNVVAFKTKEAAKPINGMDLLDKMTAPSRWEIELLCREAEAIASVPNVQGIDPHMRHYIDDGHYYRTFWCTAGLIIGKRHKIPHIMLVTGECIIWCEDGVIYHPPGRREVYSFSGDTQKIIWAFEDFAATTRHKTECTDLNLIEDVIAEAPSLKSVDELKKLIAGAKS